MWAMAGAPIDSSGENRGEARASAALRTAGLDRVAGMKDHGDLEASIADSRRDPATGVIGFADLLRASAAIADWVAGAAAGPARPLVVGGDCSLLHGVFTGLRAAAVEPVLWLVDGHPDAYDGETSPTGEAADMDLAFLLGGEPAALASRRGARPLLEPDRVAIAGHRPASLDAETARELGLVPDGVAAFDAPSVNERGGADVATRLIAVAAGRPAWLHVDLDVLDEAVFPAVSYPQPLGLEWDALEALLEPLVAYPRLTGISLADLEPDRDPAGEHARRVVELLARVLA